MKSVNLLIIILLCILYSSFSEAAPFEPVTQIFGGIGLRNGNDSEYQDIYGSGAMLKVGVNSSFNPRFRIEMNAGFMSQDGDPFTTSGVDASSTTKIIELNVSGQYMIIPIGAPVTPYVGGGLSLVKMDEKLSASYYGSSASASGSETAVGILLVTGTDFKVKDTTNFYVEMSFNSADIEGCWGKTDIGGVNIGGGIRFTF